MVISFQRQGSQPPEWVCYHAGEGNDQGEYVRVRFTIQKYQKTDRNGLLHFLQKCLPESGRTLELDGRHKMYRNIKDSFEKFWCLLDGENVYTEICVDIFRRKNESGKVGDDCERGAAGTNGLHVIYSRA